ncbi:MAG: hypothetical protein CVT94_17450 [Bacteroidetes bacterium HGW-Bacteroidetes-11]|nr:MAG: hypothetical protein CVT94_17450 [Bacteroidetes bacterium HGW-Bacteroidetes-11]
MTNKFFCKLFKNTAILLLLQFTVAKAQWTQTGPEGGYIKCMTVSGNKIFSVSGFYWLSSPEIYVSNDSGESWLIIESNNVPADIRAIASIGNSLFLGTGSGIYRSDDQGTTWVLKNTGIPPGDKWINHLTISGNTIFAAGTSQGMIRSTDNGEHWTVANSGLTDTYVYSLTATETAVFAGTGDQNMGVFRSIDYGTTWQQVKNGMAYYYNGQWINGEAPMITSLGFSGNDLYAGTSEFQGIWKSSDYGDNWIFTSMETMNYSEFSAISGTGTTVLAGTTNGGGVIRSINNGTTWSASNNGIGNHGQVTSFLNKDGNTFVGTKGGIYKTVNNGINSQIISSPGLAVSGSEIFVGTQGGGVFRTSDEGTTWEEVNNGLPYNEWSLNALYSTTTALFAWDRVSVDKGNTWEMASLYCPGTAVGDWNGPRWIEHNNAWFAFSANVGVYRSFNQGSNWNLINNGIQNISDILFHNIFSNGQTLYLGSSTGLYYSGNNGEQWNSGYFPEFNIHSFTSASFISNGNVDVIGLKGGGGSRGIYISTDQGISWIQTHNLLVHKFAKKGDDLIASGTNLEIINGEAVEVSSVFLSQNNGQSWIKISGNLNGLSTLTLTSSESKLFISKYSPPNNQVLCSADNGTTWVDVSDGLDQRAYASSLEIINDKIFAGTNGLSLWKRNLSEFSTPAQPGVMAGNEAPCSGSTETYSVENVSGVTYSWQVPDDWSIIDGNGTNNITVTVGETTGIVLVIPSNGFGTGPSRYHMVTPVASYEVNVSIEVDQNGICNGSIMLFNAETGHGGNDPVYDWLVNGFPAGENAPEFAYIAANGDVVKLLFTSNAECAIQNQVESNSITTIVNALPEVAWNSFEPDSLCINWAPVILSGGDPAGGTYTGNGVTDNIFNPAEAGPGSHLINYTFSNENNCSGQISLPIVVNVCAGIPEQEAKMVIYPNPVNDLLTIEMKNNQAIEVIELYNAMGMKVMDKRVLAAGSATISMNGLPAGNYILKVSCRNETLIKSIILN